MSINVVYNFSSSIHTSRENLRTVLAVINAILLMLLMRAWQKRILNNYWICLLNDMKNYAIRGWGGGCYKSRRPIIPKPSSNLVLLYIHSKYLQLRGMLYSISLNFKVARPSIFIGTPSIFESLILKQIDLYCKTIMTHGLHLD